MKINKKSLLHSQTAGLWRINRRFAVTVLIMLCAVAYIFTAGGHFGSTDEEDLYRNTAILSARLSESVFGADSAETTLPVAEQEVGQPLLALPWYWLGLTIADTLHPRWHVYTVRAIMTTFNLVITLSTIALLFHWIKTLATERVAFIVAALFGLTSLAWPYSQTFFREPLVGMCLLIAFWSGSRFRQTNRRIFFLLSLATMIYAIATKTTTVIAIPWWMLITLPRLWLQRRYLFAVTGTGILLALVTIMILPTKMNTLLAFSAEMRTDIQHALPDMIRYGLHGLLTSPGKGLIVTAPTILLALLGFPRFWRQHRREAVSIAGLVITFIFVYSTRRGWHGGASWGPRYLLPIVPLFFIPSTGFVEVGFDSAESNTSNDLRRQLARLTILLLATCGILSQLAATSVFGHNYYQEKYVQGVIDPANLDANRTYLADLYFDPIHSPILGHARLALERSSQMLRNNGQISSGILPSRPDELWDHFVALDMLDFWWLHLSTMASASVSADERLGFVLVPDDPEWHALANASGATLNRWQINWRDVEPIPGTFSFFKLDDEFDAMQAAGLEPSVILTYPPEWASNPGTRVPLGLEMPIESEQNVWARFVRETASRYPDIIYWEIWNEPDVDEYWGGSTYEYYLLLKVAYLTIKQANPDAQVIMSGFAHWPDPAFADAVFAHIEQDPDAVAHDHYFDISAWHWYLRPELIYERITWAQALMQSHGIDKPIWINETNAFVGAGERQPGAEALWTVTPDEQAAFVVQAAVNAWSAGAEKVFVFRLDDVPAMGHVGLVSTDLVPRPAYVAYQAVAEFLNGAKPMARWSEAGVTYASFRKTDGNYVVVVWNETPIPRLLELSAETDTVKIGHPNRVVQSQAVNNGKFQVELPPATASDNLDDYFIGGMPVFVFINSNEQEMNDVSEN